MSDTISRLTTISLTLFAYVGITNPSLLMGGAAPPPTPRSTRGGKHRKAWLILEC